MVEVTRRMEIFLNPFRHGTVISLIETVTYLYVFSKDIWERHINMWKGLRKISIRPATLTNFLFFCSAIMNWTSNTNIHSANDYISTCVFAFNLSFRIHSYMNIHHVNRTYFAQQILRCYDQKRLVKESMHGCLMKSL